MKLLYNAKIFDGNAFLLADALAIEAGRIGFVGRRSEMNSAAAEEVDMQGQIVAPGFVDVHIHGCMGHDCMHAGGAQAMAEALPRFGVTSFCPTSVSDSAEATRTFLHEVKEAMRREQGSRIIGAHLEGPFLAPKARGAHEERFLRLPSEKAYSALTEGYGELIVRVTLAPELPGAMALIERLTSERVVVSIGHTAADAETCREAIERGASLATHTFNAMPQLHHRNPGATGELLTNAGVRCEFIFDGIHVDPIMADLMLRAKGPGMAFVCTDGMQAAGMPDGHYKLGSMDVEVRDGRALIGETLAGSTLTMDTALRNLVHLLDMPIEQALSMLSYIPAQALGLADEIGRIAPGYQADFVVLNDALEVESCYVRGALAWAR